MKLLYVGSFDPIHNGHLDIIRRASRLGELTVGIATDPNKKYMFEWQDRLGMVQGAIEQGIESGDIEELRVVLVDGMTVDRMRQDKISTIIRGIRNVQDMENEMAMFDLNKGLWRGEGLFETLFLMARPGHRSISSSAVRSILRAGGDVSGLVPESAMEMINNKAKGK